MVSERIEFANILRGVGAFAVLISHFVGIFWVMHPGISGLMGVPAISDFPTLDLPLSIVADYCILIGQFGVGVFFIVSGLVIPFSLYSADKLTFLFRRALRIYPVYIVGFSVIVLSIYALSIYAGVSFIYPIDDILAHYAVVTRGPLGVGRIDGISWTLEVEIYFYLVMCVFGRFILGMELRQYILVLALIALASVWTMRHHGYLNAVQVAAGMLLLLGISYYSVLKGKLSVSNLWVLHVVVFSLLPALWFFAFERAAYTNQWVSGYVLAIVVFALCFSFRSVIKTNALLSHFSDISYPLYAVHALFGYAIMYVLVDRGHGVYVAIGAAAASAYFASLIIHVFVEKPAMAWSKNGRRVAVAIQN